MERRATDVKSHKKSLNSASSAFWVALKWRVTAGNPQILKTDEAAERTPGPAQERKSY